MITIREKEYDFSFTDYENIARLQDAIRETDEQAKKKFADADQLIARMDEQNAVEALESFKEVLKQACQLYADLIDKVLGAGAADNALGKTTDIQSLTTFWREFQEALNEDAKRFETSVGSVKPYGKKGKR